MASIFAQKRFFSSLTEFFLKFQNLAQFVRLGSKFLCVSSILIEVQLLNSNMGSQFPLSLNSSMGLNPDMRILPLGSAGTVFKCYWFLTSAYSDMPFSPYVLLI